MTENIFLRNPVKVVVHNPLANVNMRTFVFIGDVPSNISAALSHYNPSKHDKLLKEYYGNGFRGKLGLDIKDPVKAYIGGGEEDTCGKIDYEYAELIESIGKVESIKHGSYTKEIDDLDIETLLKEDSKPPELAPRTFGKERRVILKPGIEYVFDTHIFPEDKISELKEKIYLSTGIPMYRQHLYWRKRDRIHIPYIIRADGIYSVNIRELSLSTDSIYEIPIDKLLYDIRDQIKVEARDVFSLLMNETPEDNIYYVVDLGHFTQDIHNQLVELLKDTYMFELFYYGFVIKYWPQLTPECFRDYIINEADFQHIYPDLARSKSIIGSAHRIEKEIINRGYRKLVLAAAYAAKTGLSIAITHMTAVVTGDKILLNIRNIFDKLRVTRCIPEIHAYIEHDNKKYMLRKRHIRNGSDIQFPSGILMKTGITFAISLRKSDQDYFHTKRTNFTTEDEQSKYLFLNIWPNGKCHIRTIWNEEDEYGFEDINKIMRQFTTPIIEKINSLDRYAFITGSKLSGITQYNTSYIGLNICIFWKKVLPSSTFKIIRQLWEPYLQARITAPRKVQQFDKYEFTFRKGMHQFNPAVIERILTASNNVVLSNYYAYLSNNTIKQKWDQNYDGRIIRISHRTTDIRFEAIDIREDEFKILYRYLVSFVYDASTDPRIKNAIGETGSGPGVKKLRKLREQDPDLYNLKKYGSKKVYSRLCQNKQQPIIYTEDELNNMSKADSAALVKYWNFTMNKPAYYGCPTRKYPHMSFIVGVHPKQYCLPCCNKKPGSEDSKRKLINTTCLLDHTFSGDIAAGDLSRHIINYGKEIEVGRLSKLPAGSLKKLLYGIHNVERESYFLYGVNQHVPGVKHIGLLFSVAESMGKPTSEIILGMIKWLSSSEHISMMNTLLNGALITYFIDMKTLISNIKGLFIDANPISSTSFNQWPQLFTELFHLVYGISIFTFIDEAGNGELIDLYSTNILKNELLYISKLQSADVELNEQKYVVLVKQRNRVYPIFTIDTDKYFKTLEIPHKLYSYNSPIIQLLKNMVLFNADDSTQLDRNIDLIFIRDFITSREAYIMREKLINNQNLCYAVVLHTEESGSIYIPIEYSTYIADGIPIGFEQPDNIKLSSLIKSIEDINAFIREKYSIGDNLFKYKQIAITGYLAPDVAPIALKDKYNGFIYYFTEKDIPGPELPTEIIRYDYRDLNKAIKQRTPPQDDPRVTKIGESLYTNYTYQLFLIEFIYHIEKERNIPIRKQIKDSIDKISIKKDLARLHAEFKILLKDYPADYTTLLNQLITVYQGNFSKSILLESIESTIYDFDRSTINKLRGLDLIGIKAELRKIADGFCIYKEFDTTGLKFPNIYLPCDKLDDPPIYCNRGKLLLNKPVEEFIEILADDLTNELKAKYLLNSLFMDISVDYFSFERIPTEVITIYRLND